MANATITWLRKTLPSGALENRGAALASFALTAILILFESSRLNVGYADYFIYLYDFVDPVSAAVASVFLVASLGIFFFFAYSALTAAARFKVLYFLLFAVGAVIEYGYQKALGRFSNTADIESAIATTAEQRTASMMMYANVWIVVPCAVFLMFLLFFRHRRPTGLRSFVTSVVAIVVFFAALSTVGGFFIDKKFPTLSLNAFLRTGTDFLVRGPLSNGNFSGAVIAKNLSRRSVPAPADPKPTNNIVLVIDESVRGDHFSLNGYGRETTPFLDDLRNRGVLKNWGIAAAASTGSRFSYAAITTGLAPSDFPDKTEIKVNTFPTIYQYAKAMGYRTHYLDGQMKSYWGGIPDDKNYIDVMRHVHEFDDNGFSPKHDIDNRIAAEIKKIIYASTGNFIVVFKHGSHIPYQDSFPVSETHWSPSYTTEKKYDIPGPELLPDVTNAYDNAIRYNVNGFFRNLIDDYSRIPNNTLIVYTGDHGQTLFANGRSSHGGTSRAEADVPLFIIGKLESKPDTNYRASHMNIFPTLLDFMNYPESMRESRDSVSLLNATAKDSRPRHFNPDLEARIPFD